MSTETKFDLIYKKKLAERIKEARKDKKLSIKTVAQKLGISWRQYYRLEAGMYYISIKHLIRLHKLYGKNLLEEVYYEAT